MNGFGHFHPLFRDGPRSSLKVVDLVPRRAEGLAGSHAVRMVKASAARAPGVSVELRHEGGQIAVSHRRVVTARADLLRRRQHMVEPALPPRRIRPVGVDMSGDLR